MNVDAEIWYNPQRPPLRVGFRHGDHGLVGFFRPAHAVLEIDITQGNLEPLPIAIPAFTSATGDGDIAAQMSQVISNNLNRSGLFRTLDPASFIEQGLTVSAGPNFAEWRVINAQALVVGQVERQGDGRLRVDFASGMCLALNP